MTELDNSIDRHSDGRTDHVTVTYVAIASIANVFVSTASTKTAEVLSTLMPARIT